LRRNRVLLPGITVLIRLVVTVREAAAERMHTTLGGAATAVDPMLPGRLRASLTVADGSRFSEMESWRRAPTRVSGPGLVKALDRAADLEGLGVRSADCSTVPANRIAALARYGLDSKAPTLQELAEPRRTATLLAMARHLDAVAIDDALDLFALLMATRLINPARAASATERLATLPRLERASRMLAVAHRELFKTLDAAAQVETGLDVAAIWAVLEQVASREQLADAVGVVEELVPADDGSAESAMRVVLGERYRTVRPFLGLLGNSGSLAAAAGGAKVLAAVKALPELAARKVTTKPLRDSDIDADLVPPMWQRAVYANPGLAQGAVDRDAYVVCVLEQLHKALRVRDIFAAPSHRWADPRAQLLVGPAWEAVRPEILDGLGLALPVHEHLRGMVMVLDAAWTQLADRLTEAGDASTMRIVPGAGGRMRLSVEHLDALDIPESLTELRELTAAMLPRIDLPELLLEVHAWTGFLHAYVHVSGGRTRMNDLPVSVAALLIAEACNVGLVPVTDPNVEALTRGRHSHVDQNYLLCSVPAARPGRPTDPYRRSTLLELRTSGGSLECLHMGAGRDQERAREWDRPVYHASQGRSGGHAALRRLLRRKPRQDRRLPQPQVVRFSCSPTSWSWRTGAACSATPRTVATPLTAGRRPPRAAGVRAGGRWARVGRARGRRRR